ncbi:MAG: hypothetical protein A3B25_01025 [Candidatus Ryanbacteria bacterium RIFCSPLOWO2_01_FULL_48_26]|uniref:Uncharacterized protein n=1 Tax=Candidatus Ryanbacteria bacterium RIFCSPLOWO2_01_FULL_48_26 TaxID=1802126 RepID=A0A1G2GRR6_9BACT|nr:MAG: hypothetical protein A3B25_01025 [Candidatus Ryanbacteria bacterium RIFCSPLOWO2_01_FULL_48_26]
MNIKTASALFLVIIGTLLQLFIGDVKGAWFNFTLAALITLSFFCSFFEILFLTLFALLVLNWQPGISLELIIFGVMPIGAFFLRKLLPLEPLVGSILLSCAGIIVLYILFGIHIITNNPVLFLSDIVMSLAYSAVVFKTMSLFFEAES